MADFYKEPPQGLETRAWLLLVPSVFGAIGLFCFAFIAFGFPEFSALSERFRTGLVLVGAFGLAFSGEIGTLATTVEVHRKERNGTLVPGDRWALRISTGATLGALFVAFATILGTKAAWGPVVQEWGVIALGLLSVLDAYSGFREFGYHLGERDVRLKAWEAERDGEVLRLRQKQERRDDRRANLALKLELEEMRAAKSAAKEPEPSAKSAPTAPEPVLRDASRETWRSIYRSLNGERAGMSAKGVNELLVERGYSAKKASTARGWAKEAREWREVEAN